MDGWIDTLQPLPLYIPIIVLLDYTQHVSGTVFLVHACMLRLFCSLLLCYALVCYVMLCLPLYYISTLQTMEFDFH
jgi:hypothetical protein